MEVLFIILIALGVFLVLATILAVVMCVRRSKGHRGVVHSTAQPNNYTAGMMYPQTQQVTFMMTSQGQTVPVFGTHMNVFHQPQIVTQSSITNMSPAQVNSNPQASIQSGTMSGPQHAATSASSNISHQEAYQPLAQRSPDTTGLYSEVNPAFQNPNPCVNHDNGVAGNHYEDVGQGRNSYLEPMSHVENPRYLTPCSLPTYDYVVSDGPPTHQESNTSSTVISWQR